MGAVPAPTLESGAQVLVVEDDPSRGRTLLDILETEGYRVAWVRDGPAPPGPGQPEGRKGTP